MWDSFCVRSSFYGIKRKGRGTTHQKTEMFNSKAAGTPWQENQSVDLVFVFIFYMRFFNMLVYVIFINCLLLDG